MGFQQIVSSFGKHHRYSGSLPLAAVQLHLSLQDLRCVLDDGKAQTGAAYRFGMALVYPVEPFEDPFPV